MTTKICIAIPTNRGIKPQTLKSLLELDCPYEKHIVVATQGYTIAENRTYIATQALKNKCTHILSVDDDMTFPAWTLTDLLKHGKEMVGVVAHSRALPLMPVVEFFDDDQVDTADKLLGRREIPTELFKCKMVGGGVFLVETGVFNRIERPWYSTETHEFGMTKVGEDAWFCGQLRKAGIDIWCDPSLTIGHIGDYIF
jgi:hypothetical protein